MSIIDTKKQNIILPIPDRETFHTRYAGEICPEDFSTGYPCRLGNAARVLSAARFNEKCRMNILRNTTES